ncbi:MAG: nucleotidyl transferase AbiEii/AbiGii toxin family protein [Alphaproteobacteria bacterium]|jgi:hypothetical protein|nr:nucleotidyl transferase AbiEii/AbiGii toxin family protein [Alphaproteobacteria bacterium]|tara:strand:+ start:1668 stop:2282 length:615 start_codon:yes stop_codon:yes gene_type:complete
MHQNILNKDQINLLPVIHEFSSEYYLVGGTAIALQLGHRQSIDFDLFKNGKVSFRKISNKFDKMGLPISNIVCATEENFTFVINDVKFTFFDYPFDIDHKILFDHYISMPSLLDLGAMKAFAMGKRLKWKDYVDLYFLLQRYTFEDISNKAYELFNELFHSKLFREQLGYFNDIDYDETVTYCVDPVPEDRIKHFLAGVSTDPF